MSSKTLVKSLEYAYIIIENVARKNTADTVLSALRRIGYECVAVFTNSASFGDRGSFDPMSWSSGLAAMRARLEHHRGSTDLPLIWDLTHNITFQQWKEHAYEDTLPCLLRNHRYWHVGRRRHLVPG
ncbi:unnamed protein product [Durusdinium trenchii]|uniref:Uncharacterized protein n=1 Tax=Durusdinium trenchii TaxID=1381693 RepID=A0ABP0I054_9DINO